MNSNELAQIRRRQDDLREQIDTTPPGTAEECPKKLVQVFKEMFVPTTTGVYFATHPVDLLGDETEGGAGTLTPDTSTTMYVYVVGSKAPEEGDNLTAHMVGQRWVAERMNKGPEGVFIPGCPCDSVPKTLTMSVSKPTSNFGIFQPCTLQYYSPVPTQFAGLALGSWAWLSTQSFTDQLSPTPFYYYFTCFQGYYALSRVYPKTSTSPAYVDSIRYRWLAGYLGNTCTPFLLSSGLIFTGGDASCKVTISE